jgi:ribokinase
VTGAHIVVVGSLMLDLVVRVPRRPEVGESMFGRDFEMFVGGKGGNQALAAARLGAASVTMVGRVGADAFGDRIFDTLTAGGVDCSLVVRDAEVGTGVALPMVFDDGGNSIVSVPRANLRLDRADIDSARDAIAAAGMVLVQFEVAMEAVMATAAAARQARVPLLLNAAPVLAPPDGLLARVDVLVVNEVEAAALAPRTRGGPRSQARSLLALGPPMVVLTLGERGSLLATTDDLVETPPFPVEAVDSVGAGDAFCGGFAVALVEGLSPREAARFANAAGALSVTRRGAAESLPTRAEVEELLKR